MMNKLTEARETGTRAGREAELSGATLNAIIPPDHYTNQQCYEFVVGFMNGARWQREDTLIAELMGNDNWPTPAVDL